MLDNGPEVFTPGSPVLLTREEALARFGVDPVPAGIRSTGRSFLRPVPNGEPTYLITDIAERA